MRNNKPVRLTLKTARALLKQELGLSGGSLTAKQADNYASIYEMTLGLFRVEIANDWYARNGLLKLKICETTGSQVIYKFYDPKTLEENWDAREAMLKEIRDDLRRDHCDICARNSSE